MTKKKTGFPNSVYTTIDIRELLKARRQVAVIWSIEDVRYLCPELTDDQAWEVLQACASSHTRNYGITWEQIEITADLLFPAWAKDK